MTPFPRPAVAAALVLLLASARAFAAPTPEQIAGWVRDLGDDRFEVRANASRQLWAAGRAAEPALKEAARSTDTEVRLRARAILDKFKWGIYPDTPQDIRTLIGRYRAGDAAGKQEAVKGLLQLGRPGCLPLAKMAAAEDNPADRKVLLQAITDNASRAAAALLPGEADTLEALLEQALGGEGDGAANNCTAFLLLRGRLDAKIPGWRKRAEAADGARAAEVLAFLLRAKGDLAGALAAAEKANRADLVEMLLVERGDWKAGAARDLQSLDRRPLKTLGLRAAYHRLAGNKDDFHKLLAEIRKAADGQPDNSPTVKLAAEMLLVNDRPKEAQELLTAKGTGLVLTFELLANQLRLKEALALAEKADASPERIGLLVRKGRVLHLLGEKEKAKQVFEQLGKELRQELGAADAKKPAAALTDRSPWRELVVTQLQLGRKDEAFDNLAEMLTHSPPASLPMTWQAAFGKDHPTAALLWPVAKRRHAGGLPAAMRELRGLLDGKLADKDLAAVLGDIDKAAGEAKPEEREALQLAAAEACRAAGKDDKARAYLDGAAQAGATPAARLRLGDFLAAKGRWQEAAREYRLAWEKAPEQALPLCLCGHALLKAGDEREGKKLLETAALLPLGSEVARYNLAEELNRRGLTDLAVKERELLAKIGWRRSIYVGNTLVRLSPVAESRKEHFRAAAWTQEQALVILRNNIYFTDPNGYLMVPHRVHLQRARGLLAEGKVDEALAEARLADALVPGSLTVPVKLVPELEKRGRKKEADELYARTRDRFEALRKAHPNSAWCHNALAWLAAGCRRQLDEALRQAQKAVELEPDQAGYLDTLAEVHFQRGEKEKALAAMKKCVELEPKNETFRKRLKRIEAGDPSSEMPQ
ncbi:MAG TPA: hypothetical protein VFA26_17440 [Gemmataceae bacterium]|nr:hypothetical protein [Gemmataceae bacterium]